MINTGLFTSNTAEWATPQAFFDELDKEFHFDLDPCSTDANAKCELHYTIDNDGLMQNWGGAKSVLQSSVWEGDRQVGQEVLRGIAEAEHPGCYAYPGKDRYGLLPRLHLQESTGGQIHPRQAAFQRSQAGRTVSEYGCNLLVI